MSWRPQRRGNSKSAILKEKPAVRRVLLGRRAGSTSGRAVDATIVVVIVLTVMLLPGDALALHILGLVQPGPLLAGDDTVSLGPRFNVVDMLLTALQTIGLASGPAAAGNPLFDTSLLVKLTLVDTRGIGLGKGKRRDNGDQGKQGVACFHGFLRVQR